jgi:hypothetical protein
MLTALTENNFCATLISGLNPSGTDENGNPKFDLFCNGTIYGRYLTVQRMGCGKLKLNEITIFPSPSKPPYYFVQSS